MPKTTPERLQKINEWVAKNPEKFKASQKRYRERHKQQRRDYDKIYRIKNKDRINTLKRNRRRSKPGFSGIIHQYNFKWKTEHPEEWKQICKEKAHTTYLKYRQRIRYDQSKRLMDLRLETLYWYSNGNIKCELCGETHFEFLAIDHINGGGNKEKKHIPGNFTLHLIKSGFPEGFRVLCHNCNFLQRKQKVIRKNPLAPYHKHRDKLRMNLLYKYSRGTMKCECCGQSDVRVLTFNHINGNTTPWFAESRVSITKYLNKHDIPLTEINVLCHNCNSAMGYYGYCPHTTNTTQ